MTGIGLAVAATVIYNLGFICEKRALDRLPRIEAHRVWRLLRTLFTAPAWLAGFAMICCGLALQVVVLSLEPLTVAQPLQACGVVVTLAFAALVLRERLGRTELACVGVIAAAVALLTLSARHDPGADTRADPAAVAAAALPVAVIIAGGYGWMNRRGDGTSRDGAVGFGFCAGLTYGYAGLALKALSAAVFAGPARQTLAGLAAAALTCPYLYVMLGVTAVGMCLFQVALQRGRAAIVMPVSLITSTAYLVLVGSWLFGERLPASPVSLTMRLAGGLAAVAVPVILAVASGHRPRAAGHRPAEPAPVKAPKERAI